MKIIAFLLFSLLFIAPLNAAANEAPKLVVVIAIDQFRAEYLNRFRDLFGEGGFNLFLEKGAVFSNCRYKHSFNVTGAGHAVIMSGSYADVNGIIGNTWFDVHANKVVNCVLDEASPLIDFAGAEGRSPKKFLGSTVGDELQLTNQGASRVITVSGKDRAAILMGGKFADAAYWFYQTKFTTSTYYMDNLPDWVRAFNESGKIDSYFGKVWDRALPEAEYSRQGPDDVAAEDDFAGLGRTFPHRIDGGSDVITKDFYSAFERSPFASEVLVELAMKAIVHEKLGQREVTDILCIGLSANDKIGHLYGPDSHEVMDIIIRTDRILEKLFTFLDERIGLQHCLITLTADHGVAPMPEVIQSRLGKIEAGRINNNAIKDIAEKALVKAFGSPLSGDWIIGFPLPSLYLNPEALREKGIDSAAAEIVMREALLLRPEFQAVYTYTQLLSGAVGNSLGRKALYSFHPQRSGNVFYQLKPYYINWSEFGTTHGQPWSYDSHVPLLWYGAGIKPGNYTREVSPADLAPTLSTMLGVGLPTGVQGKVLTELLP